MRSSRFTWDVIKRHRAERAVVLTTHSMEEADTLSGAPLCSCLCRHGSSWGPLCAMHPPSRASGRGVPRAHILQDRRRRQWGSAGPCLHAGAHAAGPHCRGQPREGSVQRRPHHHHGAGPGGGLGGAPGAQGAVRGGVLPDADAGPCGRQRVCLALLLWTLEHGPLAPCAAAASLAAGCCG